MKSEDLKKSRRSRPTFRPSSDRAPQRRILFRASVRRSAESRSISVPSSYIMDSRCSSSHYRCSTCSFSASNSDWILDISKHKSWWVLFRSSQSINTFLNSACFSFKILVRDLFSSDFIHGSSVGEELSLCTSRRASPTEEHHPESEHCPSSYPTAVPTSWIYRCIHPAL